MTSPAATILIVDDEPHNRKLLEALLRPEGYLTQTAANGEEALASIAARAPDLILLDVMMPGMDGHQVAGRLKANPATASIPIILVTAQTTRDARLAGLNAGAEEFLSKPVDRAELWVRVRNLLRLKEMGDLLKNQNSILEQRVQERTADLQRFRTAMDATADAITLVNRTTMRFIEVNATACTMLGYTREEFFHMGPTQIAGGTLEQMERLYDAIIAGHGANEPTEHQLRRKDGTQLQVEARRHAQRSGADWLIVGVVRDITERKRGEAQRARLAALVEAAPDFIGFADPKTTQIQYINAYGRGMCGIGKDEDLGRLKISDVHPAWMNKLMTELILPAVSRDGLWEGEGAFLHRNGCETPVSMALMARKAPDGELDIFYTVSRDITERKKAENRIKRLNRVYAMLSGINALIVRVRDRDELFQEACRIAVEAGAYMMAWIGVIDSESQMVCVAASFGDCAEEYLRGIEISVDATSPLGRGPIGTALREHRPVWCQDFNADPLTAPWHGRLGSFGWGSSAAIPLRIDGVQDCVLSLYAGEVSAFDEEERRLLLELAGDISFAQDHIEKAEKLDYLAYYDVLTGLANRRLFLERVTQYVRSATVGGHKLAMVLIDLERFKNINDSFGRQAGDALLRQMAEWLTRSVGDANLLARVSADHFAAVLPEVKQEGDAARQLEKAIAALREHPFTLNDAVLRIAAKVGVALYPDDGTDAETLFKNAEAALKQAKASGERYLFHTQSMTEKVAGKLNLENQLRQALDKGEFVLHYQPKVNLASGKVTSAEALIRWNDPRTGMVPPGRFIPVLEETGLIYEIGRWALKKAIEDYLRWRAAGLPAVRIAVNVSPLQLRNRGFVAEIAHVIGIDAQAPAGLELEITESLIMEDVKHNIASLQAIRAMGISIAIDDFGTGFSSLSYLARLPVDTLKIDRSFVIDITASTQGLSLVTTIINLAHSLKLKVVAEGVETEEQSRLLRLLTCDEMQGFLFSKPVPCEIFEANFLAPACATGAV